jgi:hypothetical protein
MNLGRYPIVTHLGAGDGILQTGLAVGLLDRYEEIAFPCYPQYECTFKSFFVNHPRISIYTVPRIQGEDWGSPRDDTYDRAIASAGLHGRPHIRAGVYAGRGIGWDFSKSFYEHVDLPYEYRWRKCPIREAAKNYKSEFSFPDQDRKIFLHEDVSRGYVIRKGVDRGKAFFPIKEWEDRSMLVYANLINTADEIHCIDSSFFHFVDSLDPVGRLYLHRYSRWPRPREFRYDNRFNWIYLD